jgi:hypothetical protein
MLLLNIQWCFRVISSVSVGLVSDISETLSASIIRD